MEAAVYAVGVLSSIIGGFIAFIQIDTKTFIDTTSVVSVATGGKSYTTVENIVDLPEKTYIIVNANGQQLAHQVYPEGLPKDKHIIETPLPFNLVGEKNFTIVVDIIFEGPRTLFIPERITKQIQVEVQ